MPEIHLLSGGVDSTGVLYRRLRDTPHEIHVLHLRHETLCGRAEMEASRAIVVWLARHLRPPVYREILPMRLAGKACGGSISSSCGYAVGEYLVRHPYISTVVQGTNGDAADQSDGSLARNAYRAGICRAVCAGYTREPDWVAPHNATPKRDIWALLPEGLRALCYSCPDPHLEGRAIVPCGVCPKCREFNALKEPL